MESKLCDVICCKNGAQMRLCEPISGNYIALEVAPSNYTCFDTYKVKLYYLFSFGTMSVTVYYRF